MKRNGRTKTTPDLEDANTSWLKTNEEKGHALHGRFRQQSDQNKLEEMKHILSNLNRTRAQSGPEEEFNQTLRKSGKNTAPGLDMIRCSDIENLIEEDRAELYTILQKTKNKTKFDKDYIPEDWTVS